MDSTLEYLEDELEVHVEEKSPVRTRRGSINASTHVVGAGFKRKRKQFPQRSATLPPEAAAGLPVFPSASGSLPTLHESHSDVVLSTLSGRAGQLALGPERNLTTTGNPLLAPTVNMGLKKSISLDNLAGARPQFILGVDEDEGGQGLDLARTDSVISVSLSDFDDPTPWADTECAYCRMAERAEVELLGAAQRATAATAADAPTGLPEMQAHPDSTIQIQVSASPVAADDALLPDDLVSVPSYSSLNATADIEPPPHPAAEPVAIPPPPIPIHGQCQIHKYAGQQRTKHFQNYHRKKFVLRAQQHDPDSASFLLPHQNPDAGTGTASQATVYTSDIPEVFRHSHARVEAESADDSRHAARIRRKVGRHPPPLLPAQLDAGYTTSVARAGKDDLPASTSTPPSHAMLQHMATTTIKHSVLAVASTSRYRTKFCKFTIPLRIYISLTNSLVTQVLYTPM